MRRLRTRLRQLTPPTLLTLLIITAGFAAYGAPRPALTPAAITPTATLTLYASVVYILLNRTPY